MIPLTVPRFWTFWVMALFWSLPCAGQVVSKRIVSGIVDPGRQRWTAHVDGPVWAMKFDDSAVHLVAKYGKGSLRCWRVSDGAEQFSVAARTDVHRPRLNLPPNGPHISESDQLLMLTGNTSVFTFAANGASVATRIDGAVCNYHVESGQLLASFSDQDNDQWPLLVSHDGRRLLTHPGKGQFRLWDLAAGRLIARWVGDGAVYDNTLRGVVVQSQQSFELFDGDDGRALGKFNGIYRACTGDRKHAAVLQGVLRAGQRWEWSVAGWIDVHQSPLADEDPFQRNTDPNEKAAEKNEIVVIELPTGREVHRLRGSMAAFIDNRTLMVYDRRNGVRTLDLNRGSDPTIVGNWQGGDEDESTYSRVSKDGRCWALSQDCTGMISLQVLEPGAAKSKDFIMVRPDGSLQVGAWHAPEFVDHDRVLRFFIAFDVWEELRFCRTNTGEELVRLKRPRSGARQLCGDLCLAAGLVASGDNKGMVEVREIKGAGGQGGR